MKNIKTLLLAIALSFAMVTSSMAGQTSNDANLIFSNDAVQTMQLDKLSNAEMIDTEGKFGWFALIVISAISRWPTTAHAPAPSYGQY